MTSEPAKPVSYNSARFLKSASKLSQCPEDEGAEVAFAGRSNAGKSSAINTLTNNSKLSRTSKTPGRTQLINFFTLNREHCRLVDLPGYGYAKVSKSMRDSWQQHIDDYLSKRQCLRGIVLLMDIRHPLSDFDQSMIQWATEAEMPMIVLLTKADKLKFGAAKSVMLKIRKQLQPHADLISVELFSATKKTGLDNLSRQLDEWFILEQE